MQNTNSESGHESHATPNPALTGDQVLPAWAKGWLTIEELQRMTRDVNLDGALELKDFLPELESIVGDNRHGQ